MNVLVVYIVIRESVSRRLIKKSRHHNFKVHFKLHMNFQNTLIWHRKRKNICGNCLSNRKSHPRYHNSLCISSMFSTYLLTNKWYKSCLFFVLAVKMTLLCLVGVMSRIQERWSPFSSRSCTMQYFTTVAMRCFFTPRLREPGSQWERNVHEILINVASLNILVYTYNIED